MREAGVEPVRFEVEVASVRVATEEEILGAQAELDHLLAEGESCGCGHDHDHGHGHDHDHGEAGCAGSLPSVMNAIVDALSPYGVDHVDMPATPLAIWRIIHERGGHGGTDGAGR